MQNFVEINGVRYDAISGLSLNGAKTHKTQAQGSSAAPKNITGARHPHQLASHLIAHKAEPSHVYNRKSVKLPSITKKPQIKANHELKSAMAAKPASSLIKLSSANVDQGRASRASLKPRSASISRFNKKPVSTTTVTTKVGNNAGSVAQKPNFAKTGRTFDIAPPKHHPSLAAVAPSATVIAPASQFGKLVQTAEAENRHRYLEYKPVKQRRGWSGLKTGQRRALAFSAVGLVILLLAGFIFLQEKTNIELQLADARAGINATLPSFKPSGYAISGFRYQAGIVAINYYSSSDGHHFQLVQKSSGLDSQGLKKQLAAGGFQTLESAGQTIFANTSGTSSHAAWVSGGILYEINGNASLSNDQIIKIANGA